VVVEEGIVIIAPVVATIIHLLAAGTAAASLDAVTSRR
jgi:hypothetical protein